MNATQYARLLQNAARRRGPMTLQEGLSRTLRAAARVARRRDAVEAALEQTLSPRLFRNTRVVSLRGDVLTLTADSELDRRRLWEDRRGLARDVSRRTPGISQVRVVAPSGLDEADVDE